MQVREIPLRPRRLGLRRRRAERAGLRGAGAGSERSERRAQPASLDNANHLATSVREWVQSQETKRDKHRQKLYLQRVLMTSMQVLYQDGHNAARQRDYERLWNCQREWIGFRAACCDGRPVAVPIGCNHRLCVLCNAHRSETYREKVRALFGRLERPQLLTLTIPSLKKITKRSFTRVRRAVRVFLKQHGGWIKGGIYSLETTYHEKNGWHLHVHLLLDSALPLPRNRADFIRHKRRLEFDWLRLSGGREWRGSDFDYWMAQTGTKQTTEWNRVNRRVIDIRPVYNRDGAAFEVLKYITKITSFVAMPMVVDEFLCAVKGVRMLQTFGSWYGVKFESDVNKTWSHLRCECGQNNFIKIGKFFRDCVEMLPDGRWVVKPEYSRWEDYPHPPREPVILTSKKGA